MLPLKVAVVVEPPVLVALGLRGTGLANAHATHWSALLSFKVVAASPLLLPLLHPPPPSPSLHHSSSTPSSVIARFEGQGGINGVSTNPDETLAAIGGRDGEHLPVII